MSYVIRISRQGGGPMNTIRFFLKKRKLTITILTVIILALIVGAVFMHIRNVQPFKDDLETNAILLAKFISDATSVPLSFGPGYYDEVKSELYKLNTRPEAVNAAIYDMQDKLIVSYPGNGSPGERIPKLSGNEPPLEYKDDFLYIYNPIELKSYPKKETGSSGQELLEKVERSVERIGTLYLKISTSKLKRFTQYSRVTISIFFFSFIILLMFLITRWRRSMLQQEKHNLEQTVDEKTRELKEKNRQLEEQSQKLQEMDKMKSRFLANISHEFRTPLTLIMGPLEQMLSKTRDNEGQKKINLMLRNIQRLMGLINQLLDLSKLDCGEMKLNTSRQDIVPFLKGVTASFEPVTAKHELALTVHTEAESIILDFDSEKLEKVIFNLLSNAVKFTPAGGKITVTAASDNTGDGPFHTGSLDISISDTGPGIPGDQLEHIFNRFYQSDNTYEHHHKGSGIGLAIVKEIVELHGGKIDVRSDKGKGAEFIIHLPLPGKVVSTDDQEEDVSAYKTADALMDMNGIDNNENTNGEINIDPVEPEKDIILVVEDSADIRGYIRETIEARYTVIEAKDGKEGIEKAREYIPDLIISDIMMPGVDGYELCNQLKTGVETSHIPIIMLTAKASEESVIRGLETGADDYIVKPFSIKILCARIKNLIDLRTQLQQTQKREMSLQPAKMSMSRIDKTFLVKLKEVIKKNLSDPDFTIEQLSREMNMSQATIYRKIRALIGEKPSEFIRSCRLKRGAELLKNNFGSVLEVAFEVGFASATYFTRCFKKKFHQLPSTYQEFNR